MPSREVTEAKLSKHLRLERRAAPLPRHADTLWSQGTHRRAAAHVPTPAGAWTPAPCTCLVLEIPLPHVKR